MEQGPGEAGHANDVFAFGSFVLDPALGLLQGPNGPVPIGHRALTLLKTLVERRGEVISKAALLRAAWPGLTVEENNLPAQIAAIRRALAGEPGARDWIVTVARTGYRFVGEVERRRRAERGPETRPIRSGMLAVADETIRRLLPPAPEPPEATDAPTLAVMPFANRTGDPQQDYFALGMTDEIVTSLSRVPWLTVIARASTATFSDQAFDSDRIGRALGVRYVLRGSLAASGGVIRIQAQLIEAHGGAHVWADHFDGEFAAIFELQDRVALAVAGAIEPTLQAREIRRATQRPTADLSAYDLYLRALPLVYGHTGKEGYRSSLDLLERALAIDGTFGRALALASNCHLRLYRDWWSEAPEAHRHAAASRAERALVAGVADPDALANAAYVLAHLGEDIGAMVDIMDRALQLSPSFARGWYLSGVLRNMAGQPEAAIEHLQRSLRLNPREQIGVVTATLGIAHFLARDFSAAARLLARGIQETPGYPGSYRFLASCLVHMGRLEEARAIVARLRTVTPVLVPNASHYREEGGRELFLSGLRMAIADP